MPPKRQLQSATGEPPAAKKRVTRSSTRSAASAVDPTPTPVVHSQTEHGVSERQNNAAAKKQQKEKEEESPTIEANDPAAPAKYWLMKAEPETRIEKGKDVKFSIDDLAACDEPQGWDGVRNYGARNNLKSMKEGDLAFFYHSNCKDPGIVGIMRIAHSASVDETAFDPKEPYYDPKSQRENPRWYLVHVEFVRRFKRTIGLHELKTHADGPLKTMPLLKQGRLSVSEVPEQCWRFILSLEEPTEKEEGDET